MVIVNCMFTNLTACFDYLPKLHIERLGKYYGILLHDGRNKLV